MLTLARVSKTLTRTIANATLVAASGKLGIAHREAQRYSPRKPFWTFAVKTMFLATETETTLAHQQKSY
jgi:hypothetical protein